MFQKLATFITRHAVTTVVLAVVVLATAGIYGTGVFSRLGSEGFYANGSPSDQVEKTIDKKFAHLNPNVMVLLSSPNGQSVGSPSYDHAAQKTLEQIADTSGVRSIISYYSTGESNFVSHDKHKTYALVFFKDSVKDSDTLALDLKDDIKNNDLTVTMSGEALVNAAVSDQIEQDIAVAETISFIVLTFLLIIVFRGVVAAVIPLALGGFAILVSFLLLRILSDFTPIVQYAVNVIIALGLGLAIDYSLLIISRFREELPRHSSTRGALVATMHTAGHTVFFSGVTVIISLLSITLFPIDMLRSMGLGGVAAVVSALIGGLIVLPAILALLGRHINSLSFGKTRRGAQQPARLWHRLAHVTMARPIIFVVIILAFLVAAGSPLLHYQTGDVDETALPKTSQVRKTIESINHDFPGSDTRALNITYTAGNISTTRGVDDLTSYVNALSALPHVTRVDSIVSMQNLPQLLTKAQYHQFIIHPDRAPAPLRDQFDQIHRGDTTLLTVYRDSDLSNEQINTLVDESRALSVASGVHATVGGPDTIIYDEVAAIQKYAPYAVLLIVAAITVMMFLMLDSVVLPLQAMLLNALSLSVALGTVVWVFQDGHLARLVGFNTDAGIGITQPVIIFAIAFGLSMDYSVFLYGRIKEEYDKSKDTRKAIREGLAKTGGVITSAAILLFVVVAAFATSKVAVMQQIGLGLSVAVLVDAFIVRIIFVPAVMALLGPANWWAPRWLHRFYRRTHHEE